MKEGIAKKKWGVDLYTTEELIIKLNEINLDIDKYNRVKRNKPLDRQVIKMRDAFQKELELRKGNDPRAEAKRIIDDIIEKYVFENGSFLDESEDVVKVLREYQNRYRHAIGFAPRDNL